MKCLKRYLVLILFFFALFISFSFKVEAKLCVELLFHISMFFASVDTFQGSNRRRRNEGKSCKDFRYI